MQTSFTSVQKENTRIDLMLTHSNHMLESLRVCIWSAIETCGELKPNYANNLLCSPLSASSFLHSTQRHPMTSWRFGMGLLRMKCLWRKLVAHCCLKESTRLSTSSPFSLRLIFTSPSLALPLTSQVSVSCELHSYVVVFFSLDLNNSFCKELRIVWLIQRTSMLFTAA